MLAFAVLPAAVQPTAARADNPIVQTIYTADPAPLVLQRPGLPLHRARRGRLDLLHDEGLAGLVLRRHGELDRPRLADEPGHLQLGERRRVGGPGRLPQRQVLLVRAGDEPGDRPDGHRRGGRRTAPPARSATRIGRPLVENGEIDPTVFIDDDGQAYLYWGNPNLWYVRLNADMISYSGSPTQIPLTTAGFGTRTGDAEPAHAVRGRALGLQAQRPVLQRVRGEVLLGVHRLLHRARPDRAVDLPRHGHAHPGQQLHQPRRHHRLQRRLVLLLPQRRAAGRRRLHPLGRGGEVHLQRRRHASRRST